MIGKIDPSQNPQPKRPEPSEDLKKNKSKTLEVSGPILEQRIPNGEKVKTIYADKKIPHQYKKQTDSNAAITNVAKNNLMGVWKK